MGFLVDDADILAILKLGGVDQFNTELGKVNQKVKDGADTLAKAVNIGIAAGAAALGLAVKNAAEFERKMANVNTIANLDPSGMKQLSEEVKAIAMVNPANMESLTSGLYDLVSSGVPAAESTKALALAAAAASAGLTGVDTAIRAGMANINSYGLPISELTRVFDLQFQAVNVGVLSYDQLATSIGNALPAAQNLKVPLDELYASVAQLTLSGIDSQSSTTYLGRLFSQLADPEITGKIEANGIKVWGPDGSFRGLVAVLKDMDAAVKGMTDEQRANFFNSMGFTEQSNKAMLALVGNLNGENGFLATMEKMAQAPGAVNRAYQTQMETFSAQSDKFANIVKVSLIDSGNAFIPILGDIVKLANENPEATKTLASSIGTLAVGFGALAGATKGISMLSGVFATLSASPLGIIAMGVAGVAAGIVALNTAIDANQASVLEEIGATSDNIEKVGQLAGTIETLRGKKELTKDETIKLKDSEKALGDMLGSVGLNLDDYTGKLGSVKDSYEAIKLVNLTQQLEDLERQIGTEGGVLNSIAAGVAVLSPALAGMISDDSVGRSGQLADRMKKIKEEIAELNKPEGVAAAGGNIDALGNAAAGTDGNGGAANKIKLTKEQLQALKEEVERQNYKETKEMKGLGYIEKLQTDAMAANTQIRGLTDALTKKDTGLIGAFPEVKTGADNAALGIGAIESAALGLSKGLEVYNPKLATFVDNIWKIAQDKKLDKSELPGLFKSIGDAASEANPKVGQLFTLLGTFAESGFNPVTLAVGGVNLLMSQLGGDGGTVHLAARSIDEMTDSLGAMYQPTMDAANALESLTSQFQSDRLDQLKNQQQMLTEAIDFIVRSLGEELGAEPLRKYRAALADVNEEIEDLTGAFSRRDMLDQLTENMEYLLENTQEMLDTFGELEDETGIVDLLNEAIAANLAFQATLDPTSQAFADIADQIQRARDLLAEINGEAGALPEAAPGVPEAPADEDIPTGAAPAPTGDRYALGGYVPRTGLATLHADEFVLTREATAALGASRLTDFNASLDPAVLAGGSAATRAQQQTVVNIIAGNTTPETWFRVSDKHIQPRIDQRTRKFQVKANPYAE
jgi:TP901 family phage tail tape measure protein